MSLRVDLSILNQKGTPAFYSDTFANRPAFGFAGRVFISTDTGAIYEDTGTAWTLIADAGAGTTGTLQQVTTNGNTTTQGISITAGGLSSNSITNTSLTTGSVAFVGAAGLMTQDNANLFWDDTNNRLGINTAVPGTKLDVHGTGTIATFNGTTTNNGYIGFQNAGVTKWTIGNQYAGATNSFAINNSSGTAIFSITGGTQANFSNSLVSLGTFSAFYVGDQIRVAGGAIDGSIHTNSGDNLMFIGATSTGYGANIDLSTGSIAITDRVTATRFVLSGATSPSGLYYTSNRVTVANYTSAGTVVIETNGGTTAATFNADQSTTFTGAINGTSANFTGALDVTNTIRTDGASNSILLRNGFTAVIRNPTNNTRDLQIEGDAVTATFKGNGIVLVGTTTDNGGKLQVSGTGASNGILINGTSASVTIPTKGLTFNTGFDVGYISNYTSAGALASLYISSGVIQMSNLSGTGSRAVLADASGNLSAPVSDISVKENIQPIGYGLNEILKMNPVWFNFVDEYKNYGSNRQNGNIAQEMEKIIPEAVFTTPTTNKMGINYDQLHAIYIKAIQELNDKLIRNNIN